MTGKRGPNSPRYLPSEHVSVAWVDIPQRTRLELHKQFPTICNSAMEEIASVYEDLAIDISDASAKTFHQGTTDRQDGIKQLEVATNNVASAIDKLPDVADLLNHVFILLAQAQIAAKQQAPNIARKTVLSEADARIKAAVSLCAIAKRFNLDARQLVKAMEIHDTHSELAWSKWFNRLPVSD